MDLQALFGFGAVAHGVLVTSYALTMFQWTKVHTLFYLLGHVCIVAVMLLRIDPKFIGSMPATLLGSAGHGSLFVFAMLYVTMIAPFFKQNLLHQVLNAGFIVGQVGMIVNYVRDYLYGNAFRPLDIASISTFLLLFVFYVFKTIDTYHTQKIGLTIGMALVGILYLLLAINGFMTLPESSEKST